MRGSPAAIIINAVMGSKSMIMRIAPLDALQTATIICEGLAAALIVVSFGTQRPLYTVGAMALVTFSPTQDLNAAARWLMHAVIVSLFTTEPMLASAVVVAAMSATMAAFNPFEWGFLIAAIAWTARGGRTMVGASVATAAAIIAGCADVEALFHFSYLDVQPHNGNSWLMYQLLFPRFVHGFFMVSMVLCFAVTSLVATSIWDRGSLATATHIAAVAAIAQAIFQPECTQNHVLAALAYVGATNQGYRIAFGFFILGTLFVVTPLAHAYRFAWMQLGSMPQPNMAFYGATVHQLALALLLIQFVTRVAAEAKAARRLRKARATADKLAVTSPAT